MRRPITVGAQVVVLDDLDRVLLVQNSYDLTRGLRLPGGSVKRGETLAGAAERELAEETGIRPTRPGALALLGVYANFREGKSDHVGVFVLRSPEWLGGDSTSAEIAQRRFVPVDDLPPETTPATRRRVLEALGRLPVSTEW